MRAGLFAFGLVLIACARGEPAKSSPPAVAPVEVPAAPEEANALGPAPPPRDTPSAEELPEQSETRASFEFSVDSDGGNVVIKSTPDSGVRVWGTFNRTDGGFSFSGGFSTGDPDAGAP